MLLSPARPYHNKLTDHTALSPRFLRLSATSLIIGSAALVATSHSVLAATPLNNNEGQSNNNSATLAIATTDVEAQSDSAAGDAQQNLYLQLRQQATHKNLADHPTWRRLLYFTDKTPKPLKADISPIDNPEFFISPEGKHNPQAELEALLKLMTLSNATSGASSGDKANNRTNVPQATQDILCRFPARRHWLQEQLDISDSALTSVNCPDFSAWMADLDPQQLSVIFAEEYLDNPLSAFGHTLMLIDSTKSLADSSAIDHAHALNDTVAGSPDDSFVVYAVKSMTGLYPNDITIDPYPEKLAYYLQGDQRDVWRYPLNLSKAEVQQIIRHVWESKDLGLPYYFTTDNCASEILRYIDIVRPENSLLSQLPYVVVPSDVVRLLAKEGLITEQNYLPADDTLKQAKYNVANLDKPSNIAVNALQDLPDSVISDEDKLLPTAITPASNNPINAHPIKRAMVGVGQPGGKDNHNAYLTLGVRAGFNDLLDRPAGYPQNFDFEGLSARLRVYDNARNDARPYQDRVQLQDLTLIRGRSFNPINSAKSGKTWGVNLGATRVHDGSEPKGGGHLVANAAYEQGGSLAFGTPRAGSGELPPHLCYALAAGAAQVGKGINNGWRVGVGANLGCRYQFNPKLRAHAELQLPYWYHGDIDKMSDNTVASNASGYYWQPIATLGMQYDIDRTQAVRLQGSYDFQDRVRDQDDVQLSYVKYF